MNRKQANKYIHIHFLAVAWLVSRTAWQVTLGLRIRTRTDSQLQLQLSQQLEKVVAYRASSDPRKNSATQVGPQSAARGKGGRAAQGKHRASLLPLSRLNFTHEMH